MMNWWPQVLSGFPCDISLGEKIWEARSIAAELPRFSHLGGDILPGHDCVDGLFAFASLNRHWTQGKVDSYERMPRREMVPCSVDFGLCLFEPHATCPETLAKSEIVERASAISAFSILFSTCKAPVPQLGALSNCCPPSFRCTRNRVVSFNLTRSDEAANADKVPHQRRYSQPLSSLPQRKTNRNISLPLAHVQLWLRLSNLATLSNWGRLSSANGPWLSYSIRGAAEHCGAWELPSSKKYLDSFTMSRWPSPQLRWAKHLVSLTYLDMWLEIALCFTQFAMYPPKTAASGSTPKKSTCICGIYGLAGLLACRALFLGSFRRLASSRLDMARQPSNRSRLSSIHGSTFTGCHSWFFLGKDMVCSIERQVVKLKPCLNGLALQVRDKL